MDQKRKCQSSHNTTVAIAILIFVVWVFFWVTKIVKADTPVDRFVIGVWQQPATNFQKWKDRGIDTILTEAPKPANADRLQYANAVQQHGLRLWIGPDSTPNNDLLLPGFEAWVQQDEPENWPNVVKNPDGSFNWPATTTKYRSKYAELKFISPTTPIYGNFNGGPLLSAREVNSDPRNPTIGTYKEFFTGADIICSDFYVRSTGRSAATYPATIGASVDRIKAWAPGKPAYQFIETGWIGMSGGSPPTPSELRASVWNAVIHGAAGIMYFPLKVQGGFMWDNTPADNVPALVEVNKEMRKYEKMFLKGVRTPGSGQSAQWVHQDGSVLHADMRWDGTQWQVNLIYKEVDLIEENKRLRERLRKIDKWYTEYPKE